MNIPPFLGGSVVRLSLGRRSVNLLPVRTQRTNALTYGVVVPEWLRELIGNPLFFPAQVLPTTPYVKALVRWATHAICVQYEDQLNHFQVVLERLKLLVPVK